MSVAVSLFTLCTLVSSLQCGNCLEIPKWADIFSALQPYKDENNQMLEEVDEADNGEPRLGFVQLNSGTTTFNATLNLTGHILLGLGIASSLLLYMFFNAFDTVGGDGYGFAKNKRDTSSYMDIITLLDEAIQSHTGGSADANLCADKFLCQLLSDGEENISPSNNTLRSFLWKKLSNVNNDLLVSWRENGQSKTCLELSTKCFLDPYEIKAVLNSPITEWQ